MIRPDALDRATAVVGFADDAVKGEPQKFVFSIDSAHPGAETIELRADSVMLVDDALSSKKPGEKSQVSIVLKVDDSTISISADSLDEALKKITEQITAMKENTPQGKKEHKALLQLAEHLEEILKSQQIGASADAVAKDGKKDGRITNRIVVRQIEDVVKSANMSPEKKAEIEKLRKRIQELNATLAETKQKLAKIEGGSIELKRFSLPLTKNVDARIEARTAVVIPDKLEGEVAVSGVRPTKALTIRKVEATAVPGKVSAEEVRMQALEKKLNKVIEAIESLKTSKGK